MEIERGVRLSSQFLMLQHISFPDNLETYFDLWLVGDAFFKDMLNGLHALREAANQRGQQKLYLHDKFNVKEYYP